MKRALATLSLMAMVLVVSAAPQNEEPKFGTYEEMHAHIVKLYQEKNYGGAARVLEKALSQFPDFYGRNAYNLALMYGHLKEYEKAAKMLQSALDKGIFYSKYDFWAEVWASLKEQSSFKEFFERNNSLVAEARKKAKPEMLVEMPEGYAPGKKYPLFIGLHGGGENIAVFKDSWKSETLKKEFIVAYLQSSQLIGMDAYNWTEDIEITKKEITEAFGKISAHYPIDEREIVIGGFSSGGAASLEVVLNGLIPVQGFIVLCPAIPEKFTHENVREAKERGASGVLLTSERDGRLDQQKKMDEIMTAEGFPHQFFITPAGGHWYPVDIDKRIDDGIKFIRQNRKK